MTRGHLFTLVACIAAVSTATLVRAEQSPFKPPSNLLVLPKDTKLAQIVPMMKGFTQGLGVRCQFCHSYTGDDPNALENFDFPGDTVPAKLTARKMMTMTETLNADLSKALGAPADGAVRVTCFTCHRGEHKPQTVPGAPRVRPAGTGRIGQSVTGTRSSSGGSR